MTFNKIVGGFISSAITAGLLSHNANAIEMPKLDPDSAGQTFCEMGAGNDLFKKRVCRLLQSVETLSAQVAELQAINATNEATIAALQAKTQSMSYDTSGTYPIVRFTGVNVQIQNNVSCSVSDEFNAANNGNLAYCPGDGTGNLIIGRNTAQSSWSASLPDHRTGSHNVVIGSFNNYSGNESIVNGLLSSSSNISANVIGGYYNNISSHQSTIVSGRSNTVSGGFSAIVGGERNTSSGAQSAVLGASYSSATGGNSSVSGGSTNTANSSYAHVSGGYGNTASGNYSTISGGNSHSVSGLYDWQAGSLFEDQ